MTLSVAADNRIACAVQLYDKWHGYYVLQRLVNGAYVDVRRLSREEAMTYRAKSDEALRLEWRE